MGQHKFTPQGLQASFDYHFATTPENELTFTGLAILVGSKSTLHDYFKHPEFSPIVAAAKLKVENSYEKQLRGSKKPTGAIFALRCQGWDHSTAEHGRADDLVQAFVQMAKNLPT